MNELAGLLTINGVDVYERFGAFLAETAEDEHANYDALMASPPLKEQAEVSVREEDGVRLRAAIEKAVDARRVTLRFAITAPDDAQFIVRYATFITFLKTGDDGWLRFRLTDVGLVYTLYMLKPSSYSQTIPFNCDKGKVAAIFSITFREPKPALGMEPEM